MLKISPYLSLDMLISAMLIKKSMYTAYIDIQSQYCLEYSNLKRSFKRKPSD